MTARVATRRFMVRWNGLSRQASRMTRRSRFAGSSAATMRSSDTASSSASISVASSRVDRDHVVHVAHLDAVAGVVHDRDVGVGGGIHELAQGALEIEVADVLAAS